MNTSTERVIVLLHILSAIVGFGGVIAHGSYHAKAFRATASEAATLLRTTASVTNLAHYGIYATFVTGILAVALTDDRISFSAPWISAAFLVWFILVGVAHGLVRPAVKALLGRATEIDDDTPLANDATAAATAKKLALGEALTQLLLVVALYLMIFQPGN